MAKKYVVFVEKKLLKNKKTHKKMKYFVVHLQTLWPIKYTFVNTVLPFHVRVFHKDNGTGRKF